MRQLLLVDPIALYLSHGALVIQMSHSAIDLWVEIVVIFEELELTQGVSAERSGGREGGGLEGLNVLMGVAVYHAVYEGVFAKFKLDVLGGLQFSARETDVERDIVSSLIQCVPLWDLRSWSIILPSKPQVSLLPFVGWSSSAICSW